VKVRVRYAQVALVDQHRQQGGHRGVAKGFVNSEQEQGRQDHCGVDVVGENRCGQQKQNHHSDQPGGDDDGPAVDPVRHHAGVQPEHQPGQPLQKRRHRHGQRVVRLRCHEQGPGGKRDPVTKVGHPRRGQQPAEAVAEA